MASQKNHLSTGIHEAVQALKAESSVATDLVPQFPIRPVRNSGLYACQSLLKSVPGPLLPGQPRPAPASEFEQEEAGEEELGANLPILPLLLNLELRLDVDGYYPQMQASGMTTLRRQPASYWIARIRRSAPNTYEGDIWYKDGNLAGLPYTYVQIEVSRGFMGPKGAQVTFSGGVANKLTFKYGYKSAYFHRIEFEFDSAEGVNPVLSYDTGSHPNRPATLPVENLTSTTVFRRAGFEVAISPGDKVPLLLAGADSRWSNAEMHDAMQIHWSKFANRPQWALWTFLASLHEMGSSLGGIMFDDIGPNHRQGCGIFLDSFIKQPPAGDPAPNAWINRMAFWTTIHEMGHCFNLAHSWQKSLGVPWIPLVDEPNARSFMNYPYRVAGGEMAFFADFGFRFSDAELLFLRHAPYRYVQPGNADWFDHHGFQQGIESLSPPLNLDLEFEAGRRTFDFLEPIVAKLTLTNISDQPQLVEEKILSDREHVTLIIKKQGKAARQLVPFVQLCWKEHAVVLNPGEKMSDSLFAVGQNGWDLAEPGSYTLQASVEVNGQQVISRPVAIRVSPPKDHEEELLAQDYFSDGVGRVLAFDGSMCMEPANNSLKQITARLPKSRAAIHAHVALAAPQVTRFKRIDWQGDAHFLNPAKQDIDAVNKTLLLLDGDKPTCASTLGSIDFDYYRNLFRVALGAKEKSGKGNQITVGAGR